MMNVTIDGYLCPKCGYKIVSNWNIINVDRSKKRKNKQVYSGGGKEDSLIVQRACPGCRNPKAYQSIIVTIGEHSGVNTDRFIKRYKCTKCFHTWIEN
jgi:hypothetical protein